MEAPRSSLEHFSCACGQSLESLVEAQLVGTGECRNRDTHLSGDWGLGLSIQGSHASTGI